MFFSLILCTINRVDCLSDFFESLTRQPNVDFEVILVDQNKDNRVENIINQYKGKMSVRHIKSSPGLSKARNLGLKYAQGEIVAFPDDDCYYSDHLLSHVRDFFLENKKVDMLSVKMTNSIPFGRKVQENTIDMQVTKEKVFELCASISMFVKKNMALLVGGFDEDLGLGTNTRYCAGEDYDFPLKILNVGGKIFYTRKIEVFHPWDDRHFCLDQSARQSSYWAGATELLLLNRHGFSAVFRFRWIARRIAIIFYFYITGKTQKGQQSLLILKGQISHWKRKHMIQ